LVQETEVSTKKKKRRKRTGLPEINIADMMKINKRNKELIEIQDEV